MGIQLQGARVRAALASLCVASALLSGCGGDNFTPRNNFNGTTQSILPASGIRATDTLGRTGTVTSVSGTIPFNSNAAAPGVSTAGITAAAGQQISFAVTTPTPPDALLVGIQGIPGYNAINFTPTSVIARQTGPDTTTITINLPSPLTCQGYIIDIVAQYGSTFSNLALIPLNIPCPSGGSGGISGSFGQR